MKDPDQTSHDLEHQPEKIGQLLLKHTQLTEEQLEEALELRSSSGMLLGQILLQKGLIQPHDIIKVICHQIDRAFRGSTRLSDFPEKTVHWRKQRRSGSGILRESNPEPFRNRYCRTTIDRYCCIFRSE